MYYRITTSKPSAHPFSFIKIDSRASKQKYEKGAASLKTISY